MNDDGALLQPLLAGLSEHDRAEMLQRLDRPKSERLHVQRTPAPPAARPPAALSRRSRRLPHGATAPGGGKRRDAPRSSVKAVVWHAIGDIRLDDVPDKKVEEGSGQPAPVEAATGDVCRVTARAAAISDAVPVVRLMVMVALPIAFWVRRTVGPCC
jgi:hypothetical protein